MTKARNIANTTLVLGSTTLSLGNTTTSVSGLSLTSPTINGAASSKSLIIKSNATSPGNALEIQNSSATPLFTISASGQPYYTTTTINGLDTYSESGALNTGFMPSDVWADKLRFRTGSYETSVDGSTAWTLGTFQPEVVDGRMDTTITLATNPKGHRWTWQASDISWSTIRFLRITTGYISPNTTYDLTFESSVDGTTWTNRGSWTGQSGYIGKRLFTNADTGGDGYVRVTIVHNSLANTLRLEGIELLSYRPGDQGGSVNGIESNLPLSWGGYKNIVIQTINPQSRPMTVKGTNLTATITNVSGNGTTVTYTGLNTFTPGQTVTITGVNPSGYNLTNATIATASVSQFTVTNSTTGAFVTGGTATVTQSGDLEQWQSGGGSVLAKVDSLGNFTATSLIRSGGTSSQFLKADGTVDSSAYITAAATFNLGTTSIALNRASASQSLTGISIDGNAGTVTNGVYTNTSSTISGTVTAQSFIPSSSTAPTNGMYLPAANTVGISSNTTQRMTFDANGSINLFGQMLESATVSATAAATTVTYDVMTNKNVLYYTLSATADWTINVRGNASTTLNTLMATGQSLTVVFMNTNGATAYRATAFQIDGVGVTPKWFGGSAPTAGNANSVDIYTYNIIKTGASTYTVFASINKFA